MRSTRLAASPLAARVLSAAWALLILFLTLTPASDAGTSAGVARSADAIRNLILFAPLGLLLGLAGQPILRSTALAALLSLAVELAQTAIPGRHPGLRDVAANAAGAALGGAFASALLGPVFRSPVHAARVALAAGAVAAGVVLVPGLLIRAAPPDRVYFTALVPDYPPYGVFPGRVLHARIGDRAVGTEARAPASPVLREHILDGSPIEIRALAEDRSDAITPLLRFNDGSWEVLMVGAAGDDLVVRRHALAAELGFEEPLFRLPDALPAVGREFQVELAPADAGWQVSVDGAAPRRLGPTPALARRLLADSDAFSPRLGRGLDALAFALLFAAIGVWMRRRAAAFAGLALALGAVVLAPSLVGVHPAPPAEWAGIAAGLAIGGGLRVWIRGRPHPPAGPSRSRPSIR